MTYLASLLGFSTGYRFFDAIVLFLIAIILILCTTNIVTSIRFQWVVQTAGSNGERQPPTLPYWIPYIGSMLQMGNLHGLYEEAA
jgi:hypothetical protein